MTSCSKTNWAWSWALQSWLSLSAFTDERWCCPAVTQCMHRDDTHSRMWVGLDSIATLAALFIQIFAGIQTTQLNMSLLDAHICRCAIVRQRSASHRTFTRSWWLWWISGSQCRNCKAHFRNVPLWHCPQWAVLTRMLSLRSKWPPLSRKEPPGLSYHMISLHMTSYMISYLRSSL